MAPTPLPRCRSDARLRFLAELPAPGGRITRRAKSIMTDALRCGLITPEDLRDRVGIAVCTAECWAGARLLVELREDPGLDAWLAAQGLRLQPRTVAALIIGEQGLLVGFEAILLALRSDASPGLIKVLMNCVRAALPDEARIESAHGVGFRYRGPKLWVT